MQQCIPANCVISLFAVMLRPPWECSWISSYSIYINICLEISCDVSFPFSISNLDSNQLAAEPPPRNPHPTSPRNPPPQIPSSWCSSLSHAHFYSPVLLFASCLRQPSYVIYPTNNCQMLYPEDTMRILWRQLFLFCRNIALQAYGAQIYRADAERIIQKL